VTAASVDEPSIDMAIDALYAGPLEGFVAARSELAKRLRSAGDRAGAERVKALPKPSVSAWAMNQLWWHERPSFEALLDAGAAVRAAQMGGAGPSEQASAAKERRRCLERLLGCAEDRLGKAGHAAAAATLRRIATSLDAAAAHGRAPIDPAPGRFHADLEPPGFEILTGAASPGSRPAPSPSSAEVVEADAPRARAQPVTEPDHAAIARAAAQARVAEAAQRVDATTRAFDDAALAAQQAAEALAAARARAEAAAHEAEQAELRFRRATKEAEACRATAQAAHERLREATGLLARTEADLLGDG
jgi:hypothetical protein